MSATTRRIPVYEVMARELLNAGVERAFGLMGEDTAKLVTYLTDQPGFSYYAARHEQMATAMADGYARLAGRLGVAILSRGPGAVNGLTAAISARKHGTPLLVIVGDSPAGERVARVGVRYPKHVRQAAIVEACDLVSETIPDAGAAASVTRAAVEKAAAGAVVVLNVPTDLFGAETAAAEPAAPHEVRPEPVAPSDADLAAVVALLEGSARPVLLAGHGAVRAGAREAIAALGDRSGALLATTLLAKDLFHDSPWDLGICGGFAGATTRALLGQADLVVAFGASLNTFTSGGGKLLKGARVVHIDTDASQIGASTPVDLPVVADARALAEAVATRVGVGLRWRTDAVRAQIAADKQRDDYDDESGPRAIDTRTAVRALNRALPANRSVIVDAGAYCGDVSRYVSVPQPDRFAFCLDFSAVGVGHGTALGAAVARPDATTALFIGDGGLLLTLGELETAQRCAIPLIIVVLDDGAYGAERHYLDVVGVRNDESVFGMVDFAGIAAAIGMQTMRVEHVRELDGIGDVVARRTGPLLVDIKINGAIRPLWLEELYTATGYGR